MDLDAYGLLRLLLCYRCWQRWMLKSPKTAWGRRAVGVRRARLAYGSGPHTLDFVLYVRERLGETMLHTAARQQMQPRPCSTATGAWIPALGNSPRALWLGAVERALADGRTSHLLDSEDVDAMRPLFHGHEQEE